MEIFNMVRGHFALLIDKPFTTPSQGKPFSILRVNTKEGDWQMVLRISTGNTTTIYISDILRIYTFIVSSNCPLKQSKIEKFVDSYCLQKGISSYAIPLIATFSDIEIDLEPEFTICFKPLHQ